MNNWFIQEYLIREKQLEVVRRAGESWKYTHAWVSLLVRFFPAEKRQFHAVKRKARSLN
ncbi:hypothetical protein PAEVO_43790 [Paenibacillus sp. GM2FR]|nr:hypothetical protein PAEVO_43790 [Paenibacillus sp. GM2FR]